MHIFRPKSRKNSIETCLFGDNFVPLHVLTDKTTVNSNYLQKLGERFEKEGGIKERMYAVRTGYRQQQEAHMRQLEEENAAMKAELDELKKKLGKP